MVDEDLEDGHEVNPARWSWFWAAGFAVNTIGNVGRLVTAAADELSLRIARHDAWQIGQQDFADSVRRDLEMIPQTVGS